MAKTKRENLRRRVHAGPDEAQVHSLEDTVNQFKKHPPKQNLWQRFTAWLSSCFYYEVEVPQPDSSSFGGAAIALRVREERRRDDREDDEQRRSNFIRGAWSGITGGVSRVVSSASGHTRRLQTSPEVQALKDSQAFQAIKAHHKVLANDKRSHTYFFGAIDMTVGNKAAALHVFITEIDKATLMSDVEAAFTLYREALTETLGTGQNITTRALGLRTTSVKLIDALLEEKNHPTVVAHRM